MKTPKDEGSPVKVSMIDISKYGKLSEEDRRAKVKKILEAIREESLDDIALDIPPREIEYLND